MKMFRDIAIFRQRIAIPIWSMPVQPAPPTPSLPREKDKKNRMMKTASSHLRPSQPLG
jgi:hypothetical protein